jgi:superfamily II DNA or RNA helicase
MPELYYDPNYFLKTIPNIDENDNLRIPQKIAYARAFDHFVNKSNTTDAIIILPTGVGKTGLMGLLPYGISKGRVLIITPQLVIKDGVVGSLDPEYPENFWLTQKVFCNMSDLPCLIEYEGRDTKDEVLQLANIVVVNIQKLQSRLANSLINRVSNDFFDMIIVDEAHHSTALTWLETLQYFSNAKVIKLTGTPFRSDDKKIIGEIIYEYKLSAAMAHGYVKSLENFKYIPEKLYLTIDGDETKKYSVEELLKEGIKDQDWISRTVAYSEECSEKVVLESIKILENKLKDNNPVPHKIIAVACSIPHAIQIKNLYEKHNYKCSIVHSEMEKSDKEKALQDIENHRVNVVINVAMLGEGYDHPYLSIAAIFRPFRTLLPYAQFIGRVLRAIPNDEAKRADDNIAQIVCHQELNLDKLWDYYKKEKQESETIKYLESIDINDDNEVDETGARIIDRTIGTALEEGEGFLVGDTYLNTKLIEQRKKEEQEELKKIEGIQKLLNISFEEARKILNQTTGFASPIKRPDLFIKRKKIGLDSRIRDNIVPTLLSKYSLNKETDELKKSMLFNGKYSWIAQQKNNNAAMLAIYINASLKNMIGAKREEWTTNDWDIAEKKLDKIEEFLNRVLEDFTKNL